MNWIRSHNVVDITTSSKRERLEEIKNVGKLPLLTSNEIESINNVGKKYHHVSCVIIL